MDSYRADLEQELADAGWTAGDSLSGDDEIGHEPPPAHVGQDERRMQVRAYNYWSSLLGNRNFPRIADLASAELPDFADHAVILDFTEGVENPAVTMLGKNLAMECGAGRAIGRLSDVPGHSLLSRITDHCMQIMLSQAPIGFDAEFVSQRGTTLLYRGILLPFSSDGEKIEHVLGVINWKEVADPATTEGLILELNRAFVAGAAIGHARVPMQLDEWADGPIATTVPPADLPLSEWLRQRPSQPLTAIDPVGNEFALVLLRRMGSGDLHSLGEVDQDDALLENAARRLKA